MTLGAFGLWWLYAGGQAFVSPSAVPRVAP